MRESISEETELKNKVDPVMEKASQAGNEEM
jgi:hypothetical protein